MHNCQDYYDDTRTVDAIARERKALARLERDIDPLIVRFVELKLAEVLRRLGAA